MWRSVLLGLSSNGSVHRLATQNRLAKSTASRFVAGVSVEDAIAVTRELNRVGAAVQLDYLGEHVADQQAAGRAVTAYLELLDAIGDSGVDSQVSVKLSQMGLELGDGLALRGVTKVADRAARRGNFLWIDMEGSDSTERTLELYRKLRATHRNAGVALQAYLYRSKEDAESLISIGGTVRLCKGAYMEPPEVAFPHKKDVDHNYRMLTEILLSSGLYHAIATHDENMIRHAVDFASAKGIERHAFEFQMLYGIRRDLQWKLLHDGYRLRVYVPFGDQWYPYFMRRLAERPANLFFLVASLIGEVRSRESKDGRATQSRAS